MGDATVDYTWNAIDRMATVTEALREARPADAAGTDTVVPEKAFPNSVTFRRDVEAAGIEREDAEGRVVDLHALRHTFVTWLAMVCVPSTQGHPPARFAEMYRVSPCRRRRARGLRASLGA